MGHAWVELPGDVVFDDVTQGFYTRESYYPLPPRPARAPWPSLGNLHIAEPKWLSIGYSCQA
jgi:hypothetical protein